MTASQRKKSDLNEAEVALCLNLQMKYLGMKNRKVNTKGVSSPNEIILCRAA